MISDLEALDISDLRASSTTGWRWEVVRAEATQSDPYGFIYDNANTYNDQTEHPLQPVAVRFSSQSEPINVQDGDFLILTYDGGSILYVYPPGVSGEVDTYYYIDRYGSTYCDRWLCQLAKGIPTPTVSPTPSVTPTSTAPPTPSITPTITISPQPSVTPSPSGKPTPSISPSPPVTPTPLQPALQLIVTVDEAPPGTVNISRLNSDPTYYYLVINTGDTYLSAIEIRDDGGTPEDPEAEILIGVIPGPLAPNESGRLEYIPTWSAVRYNRAVATGIPTDSWGSPLLGFTLVSDEDTAIAFTLISVADSDYVGDGKSNLATWKRGEGRWYIQRHPVSDRDVFYFGCSGDLPVSGDFDGDGVTDAAIFRPGSGLWAVRGVTRFYFGTADDHPVPGNYSGNGICDAGIFRRSTGLWAIRGLTRLYFGGLLDLPVPGVYDMSSQFLPGIFRPTTGLWAIRGLTRRQFGVEGDYPVPADYDGNGFREIGIFRDRMGLWAVSGLTRIYFGQRFDFPRPADYSGEGAGRAAVYRPETGLWAIRGLTRGYWGGITAVPLTR